MFLNLGNGSLKAYDEGFWGQIAREIIVEKQGWLTLHFNRQPYLYYPPLNIWLMAVSLNIFGVGEFGVRFWSALCGFATVMVTYFFAQRLFLSRMTAFFSAAALLGFTQFVKYAKMGMMDGPLVLCITLGLYFFWRGHENERFYSLAGIMTGIGFMMKSFAAFQLPIVIAAYACMTSRRGLLLNTWLLSGFIAGFILCLPWHIYEYIQYGPAFTDSYFLYNILKRSVTALDGNSGNSFHYLGVLVTKNIPLGAVSLITVPAMVFALRREKDVRRRAALALICIAATAPVILFSLVRTKVAIYLLPAYPFLAMSVAYAAMSFVEAKPPERQRRLAAIALLLCLIPLLRVIADKHRTLDFDPGLKRLALSAKEHSPAGDVLYLYGIPEAGVILFYSERNFEFVDATRLREKRSLPERFLCLMSKKDGFHREFENSRAVRLYDDPAYLIYRITR
ncbi:MAG: ArnT family glycosyltransferase [Thermodesulfovibrionales bacterium]